MRNADEFVITMWPAWARYICRHRCAHAPLGGFGVGAALGALGRSEPRDLEPWMVLEQLNETLADHSGRAKNAYRNLVGHRDG
jgi:hypothetical protein